MADIIELRKAPGAKFLGPNALQTVRQYFDGDLGRQFNNRLPPGDRFITYLWLMGFKVVPLDE